MPKALPKSREGIAPGEYYHIVNRGAHRQTIFKEKSDWRRFLFNVLFLQSPHQFKNIHRITESFLPDIGFAVPNEDIEAIIESRFVEVVCFCLMSNHFHLLVKETTEGGIARYMQRVSDGYTKYYNVKYEATGHVFQGPYKAVHVKTDSQLLYTSAYIHRNPRDIREWSGKEFEYPWSSLQDFTDANRWGGLIVPEIVTGQFSVTPKSNYADFVKTTTAKLLAEELEGIIL
ncbi:MAG: transposase [Patescibacteria group bacterium]